MWDERYSTDEYAYGKAPNAFLAEHHAAIPKGRVLSLAEGEGRNAVFLALQGYAVTAVDGSAVGLAKARRLAEEHGVAIETIHADLATFDIGEGRWDGIVSIFCPLPSALRAEVHGRVVAGLRPGGGYLLEAYRPEQVQYGTGGGKDTDTMQTPDSLRRELAGLTFHHLAAVERDIVEGLYHTGIGAVVQAIAVKNG